MILEVVADPGRIEHDVNAVALQELCRSNAGKLQQLRRIIRAAGDKNFLARPRRAQAAVLFVLDGLCAMAFKHEALRQRRGLDMQIAALDRRAQIGERSAGAAAAPRRSLEETCAFLLRAVEIGVGGNAGFRRRHHKSFRQWIGVAPVRHRQRPAGAVILVGTALLMFGLFEIGQHVVKTPAGIAALAPAVVVLMLAAHIQKTVDRARAAQHLAARLEHLAPVQLRLGLGLVHPVDGFFLEQPSVAERNVDPDVGVLWSGFEQQHRMLAVRAQPIGEHAAGRARANDDVIEFGSVGRRTCGMLTAHAEDDYRMRLKLQATWTACVRCSVSTMITPRARPGGQYDEPAKASVADHGGEATRSRNGWSIARCCPSLCRARACMRCGGCRRNIWRKRRTTPRLWPSATWNAPAST